MDADAKIRLFTAVELPEEWRAALTRVRGELERVAPGEVRWVRSELMHLTLVFLGYQSPESLSTIQGALAAAAVEVPPLRMSLGQVGCFGPPHSLHVIWVGLAEPLNELQRLHRSLGTHLSASGVAFDQRPLVPHITVARGRRPIDRAASLRVHAALLRVSIPSGLATAVSDFILMRSRLSRLGPDYEVVSRYQLGGSRGER